MTLASDVAAKIRYSIALGLVVAAFAAGWVVQGWRKDSVIADLISAAAKAGEQAATKLAEETGRVRKEEAAARDAIQARADQLEKDKHAAQTDRDTFIAGVRSGAIRLSAPIRPPAANATSANAAVAGGSGDQARAELDPAFAERLAAIAYDGDDAIRQLNACIDIYNSVREKFNVQAEESQPTSDESGSRPDSEP